MAQIVTITNPLTGQPTQVDQLEHTAQQIDDAIARTLPGGAIDIALQKKAPAGYGLGGDAKFITSGDLNDYKNCGWYAWDEGVSNVPFAYGSCIVLNKGGYYIVHQIAVAGFGQNICIRRYYSPTDEWGAWEWVNPPMNTGVEYRTTERFMGKPVYVKLVDFGPGANNTEKSVEHGASNATVIDYGGYAKDYKGALSIPWITHSTLSVSSTVIVMTADANYSGYSVYVWIKYYKTTD